MQDQFSENGSLVDQLQWHSAITEEAFKYLKKKKLKKKEQYSEFSDWFYKPFMDTRQQLLVLSSC